MKIIMYGEVIDPKNKYFGVRGVVTIHHRDGTVTIKARTSYPKGGSRSMKTFTVRSDQVRAIPTVGDL